MLNIGILLGDDIGPEVVPECVKVMQVAADRVGIELKWSKHPIGRSGHELHGHTLPAITEQALHRLDGWIMGPIGHSAYPRNDATWIMPPIRKRFGLFAGIRPVKSYPNLQSVHKNVDILFVREMNEGMQSSIIATAGGGEFRPSDDISIGTRVVTRRGARRVAREAFEIACTRQRRKVTAVHKEPVFRLVCGMFAEECRKVAAEFPNVAFEEAMVDTIAMKLVMNPQQYDVVVTTNLFGDILSDEGAGLVGGLGLAPGLCAGEHHAMAQATHGSAPDIAGRGIANPYAMILSGKLLFEWFARRQREPKAAEAARLIDRAVDRVIAEAKTLTPDLGGSATTAQMGDAVASAVGLPG